MALNAGTYEAQIITLLGDEGDVVSYTVADGTSISKGSLMALKDPNTAIKCSSTNPRLISQPFAGIASADKVASDGSTKLGCWTYGKFLLRTDPTWGTCSPGDVMIVSGSNNQIMPGVAANLLSGAVIGRAMEQGTTADEITVWVGVA